MRHRADPAVAERDDVLAMLTVPRDESGGHLSDAELRDEMLGLLNAGHETTATAEGLPAYLEASAPLNRALYERHEVTEEIRPGRGGPPMWRMWRDSR